MGWREERIEELEKFLLTNAGTCSQRELDDYRDDLDRLKSMPEDYIAPPLEDCREDEAQPQSAWEQHQHMSMSHSSPNPEGKTGL